MSFLKYYTETWLEGNKEISQWNHFDNEGPRTNNYAKAYNARIKRILRCAHPNICQFIDLLQKEETCSQPKYLRLEKGVLKGGGRNKADLYRDLKILVQKINIYEAN